MGTESKAYYGTGLCAGREVAAGTTGEASMERTEGLEQD